MMPILSADTPADKSAGAVKVRRVDNLDALESHREAWNTLVRRNGTHTVYQTYEWHRCWWQAFGHEAEPLILLAEQDGKLVGIAPLIVSEQRVLGRKRKVIAFMSASLYTPCDFIVDDCVPEALPAMLQWLVDHSHLWSLLLLNPCPNLARMRSVSERLARAGMYSSLRAVAQDSCLILGDREADRKMVGKRTIRENEKKLQRLGRLQWVQYSDAQEILDHFDTLVRLHIARWQQTETPSLFQEAPYLAFHRTLVSTMAPAGWPHLSVLQLDGEPVGLWLHFDYENERYLLRTAYDARWYRYSPGLVALKYLLEDAIEKQIAEINFGSGQEGYKARYRNRRVTHYELRVSQHGLSHTLDTLLLRVLERLQRHPEAWRRVNKLIIPARRF